MNVDLLIGDTSEDGACQSPAGASVSQPVAVNAAVRSLLSSNPVDSDPALAAAPVAPKLQHSNNRIYDLPIRSNGLQITIQMAA